MNCEYCNKFMPPNSGRKDRRFCSDKCRKTAARYRTKLKRLGVELPDRATFGQSVIEMDYEAIQKDVSVAEAIAKGLIRICKNE